ncbi:MAG TPA: glycosyltransferase family 39 protein [Pirellulales bacterium]|nr:glycosyltransferase family 39 protein [Pirellulales bacterium]
MQGSIRPALGLLALSGTLFFTALGGAALWDEDEPIFAGAAREMLARHEWIVPYFNGGMLPDKPVLSYWVMIAGYKLFGPTDFAARVGSACFGCGTVLLTWVLGRRLFSPRVGLWGGVVLASSLSFDVVARAATPDAVLSFFCTLAFLSYVAGTRCFAFPREADLDDLATRRTTWWGFAGSYAAMGMAVLAKGPIGFILPVMAIGLFRLVTSPYAAQATVDASEGGRLATLRRLAVDTLRAFHPRRVFEAAHGMRPLMGLVIVLTVAGPWYAAVGLRTDGAWLAGFLGKHNLERFLHPLEHHRGPIVYYLIAVIIGFFPWSLFLGPTVFFVKSRLPRSVAGRERYCFLVCWIVAYLVFFTSAATKLPNYVVPLYPALALLTAAWIDAWLAGTCPVPARALRSAWITLTLMGLALAIALPIAAQKLLGEGTLLALIGVPLAVGGALGWWWHRRQQPGRAAVTFAVSAVLFALTLFGLGSVEVGRHQTSRYFADAVLDQTSNGPAVLRTFGYWRPSLVYYLGQPVQQIMREDQAREFCGAMPYHGFLLTTGSRYETLAKSLPADVTVLARGRWFLRRDELLLLGRDETADRRLGNHPSQRTSR